VGRALQLLCGLWRVWFRLTLWLLIYSSREPDDAILHIHTIALHRKGKRSRPLRGRAVCGLLRFGHGMVLGAQTVLNQCTGSCQFARDGSALPSTPMPPRAGGRRRPAPPMPSSGVLLMRWMVVEVAGGQLE
jgi:hypothetical protein